MKSTETIRFLIAGKLQREFIINLENQPFLDIPGGNLLYSAAGLGIWEEGIGLISRIGEDYPQEYLEKIERCGFDKRGIKILPDSIDVRTFMAWTAPDTAQRENPVSVFSRLGLQYPKTLLGYAPPTPQLDSRTQLTPLSMRVTDVPEDYLDATAAHLAPMDLLSHTILPGILRHGNTSTITLSPADGYMDPIFWEDVPAVINGLTAFITSEEKIRRLFQGRSENLWEMAEALAACGCEIIVITRKSRGQYVYDNGNHKRWIIPAYPAKISDPTGEEDAFCGGFLAGYRQTYLPQEASLFGSISSSFAVEGTGPFYALDALPGLAEARMESLRSMVREV